MLAEFDLQYDKGSKFESQLAAIHKQTNDNILILKQIKDG